MNKSAFLRMLFLPFLAISISCENIDDAAVECEGEADCMSELETERNNDFDKVGQGAGWVSYMQNTFVSKEAFDQWFEMHRGSWDGDDTSCALTEEVVRTAIGGVGVEIKEVFKWQLKDQPNRWWNARRLRNTMNAEFKDSKAHEWAYTVNLKPDHWFILLPINSYKYGNGSFNTWENKKVWLLQAWEDKFTLLDWLAAADNYNRHSRKQVIEHLRKLIRKDENGNRVDKKSAKALFVPTNLGSEMHNRVEAGIEGDINSNGYNKVEIWKWRIRPAKKQALCPEEDEFGRFGYGEVPQPHQEPLGDDSFNFWVGACGLLAYAVDYWWGNDDQACFGDGDSCGRKLRVVDNAQGYAVGFFSHSGAKTSSTQEPYSGHNYHYLPKSSGGFCEWRVSTDMFPAGKYDVFMGWSPHENRASDARVILDTGVPSSGGNGTVKKTTTVNQRPDGHNLGNDGMRKIFSNVALNMAKLTLESTTSGYAICDTVVFKRR